MSNNNLLPFDLEVALKQPERVVQMGTGKPVHWAHIKSAGNIVYYDHDNDLQDVKENGAYNSMGIPDFYDLMLLPEFTPEDRKWYWVKTHKDSQYKAAFYHYGLFVCGMTKYSPLNLHTIHPEPINPPE
jgi:hypothetical protein